MVVLGASYSFARPKSLEGGEWHWFWKATHGDYAKVDQVYGWKAYNEGNGLTNAAALLNLLEAVGNIIYLYMAEISGNPIAPLFGFGASLATCAKTIFYESHEYFCNYCAVGHNSLRDAILLYVIPTNVWLIVPGIVAWILGQEIAASLRVTARLNSQARSKAKVH
ncbi:hypothetical protein CPB86DRAFT_788325 [Serendipita vermifera]|nr:hypothetical protein CPB86DRAFT_788325 [Serendipita vermifera]